LDAQAISKAADEAFQAAYAGDKTGVIDRLGDIADHGLPGIHAAIMGWSAITLKCFTGDDRPAGFYQLEVTDNATGAQASVDQMYPAVQQQALQLVTLHGNRDFDTQVAIVRKACGGPDGGAHLMVASVTLAASAAHQHIARHAATCRGCSKDHPHD
jgi:hypothetical protein